MAKGWSLYVHCVPDDDLIEHVLSSECSCGPRWDETHEGEPMYIHNSLDGRELTEPDYEGPVFIEGDLNT